MYFSTTTRTHGLPGNDFLTDILGLFVESHIVDLEDFFDDISLVFVEDDSSIVVVRAHSDPDVHSLHDSLSGLM